MSTRSLQLPNDWSRLEIIFKEPESIVALEKFNEIIYHPSETMIPTLMELFGHALQAQTNPNALNFLETNPLFILLLIKRLIIHSDPIAPAQPSRANLATIFKQVFLPTFLNIKHLSPPHQIQSDSISQQLIICMTRLSTRLLNAYHADIDPLFEIIQSVKHLVNLETPQLASTLDHLTAVKEILVSLQSSNATNSVYLITKNHCGELFVTYTRLASVSLVISNRLMDVTDGTPREIMEREYQTANDSINVLLQIFKIMIEPLDDRTVLVEITKQFLSDIQTFLDVEIKLMDARLDNCLQVTDSALPDGSSGLQKFSRHITSYGDVILQTQRYHPSVISEEVLAVYLKIIEFVSSRATQTIAPEANQRISVLADTMASKELMKFHPLLVQGLKILNNAFDPWKPYSSEPMDGGTNITLVANLTAQEIGRLASIVEPFVNLTFGLVEDFDDESLWNGVDEDSSEEEMEIEEIGDRSDDEEYDDDGHNTLDVTCDQLYTHQECLENLESAGILTEKNQTSNYLNWGCSPWNTAEDKIPAEIVRKELLQLEAEKLLTFLKSLLTNGL
ncbi:hypothetical protein MJO28_001335 [Puccinia striiformis f. sp. tritici]|uniref:Uncharacterized protein n=1 Tax=Puccinia striiformis f. sp. tritici TaxID=168172 RepID=A0ACC0EUS5_9BASI|nr:hypothetical protein MJO28_001335 [Puccinia striiformis f. sp. tritici]